MPLKKLSKRRSNTRAKRVSLATTFDQKCSVKKGRKSSVKRKPKQTKRKSKAQNLRRSQRLKDLKASDEEGDVKSPRENPADFGALLNLTTPRQTPSSSNQPVPSKKSELPAFTFCSLFGDPELDSPSKHAPVKRFVTPTFQTSPQPPSNQKRRKASNFNSNIIRKHEVLHLGEEIHGFRSMGDESIQGFRNLFLDQESKGDPALLMNMKVNIRGSNPPQFVNAKLIGKGQFGKVFQAVHSVDGCIYAIKKTSVSSTSTKSRALALKELQILSYLAQFGQNPHIVRYYNSFWETETTVCMQMEFCRHGNVKDRHHKKRFIESDIWKLFSQMSTAIKFLHDHNIAHLDIKPENMLIHASGDFRLADFGHSTIINCKQRKVLFECEEGDRRYMALEILQEDFRYLGAADVFSLALSILELLTKELPHNGSEWTSLREGKIKRSLSCRKEFKSLLLKMLNPKANKRINSCKLVRAIARHDHIYMSD